VSGEAFILHPHVVEGTKVQNKEDNLSPQERGEKN
jgi:hypothetical protein